MEKTPANAIKVYLDRRAALDALTKAYTASKAEIEDDMSTLEAYLLATMQERNESQIKTDFGVAFRAPQMRVKMVNRDALLSYAVDHHDFSFFTNHIAKDGVKEFIDREGKHPPGIEVTTFITCNVRKA